MLQRKIRFAVLQCFRGVGRALWQRGLFTTQIEDFCEKHRLPENACDSTAVAK